MERLYKGIHKMKPWVRFGISPFGIWRPGFPQSVMGLDSYDALYADSRRWLHEGWVDYLAPQLYWKINAPQQSYPDLLKWWLSENPRNRHIWPGSTLSGIGNPRNPWSPSEIVEQFSLARSLNQNPGHIIWNFNRVLNDTSGIRTALARQVYTQSAIPPSFPWLDGQPPAKPAITTRAEAGLKTTVQWSVGGAEKAWLWLLQTRIGKDWTAEIIPGQFNARTYTRDKTPDQVNLTAFDRCLNASVPAVVSLNPAVQKRASLD
jgi:hypothetical protein